MSEPTRPVDQSVEQTLRALIAPLDRQLEFGRNLLATALVLAPAPFIFLWLLSILEAKHAAGWTVLAFLVLIGLGLGWEWLMDRLARWRFEQHFPVDSTTREAAIHLLGQIETPNKVEEKLRAALTLPRKGDGESVPLLEMPPETPPAPVPPTAAPTTSQPGGYYDYIPLEPLSEEAPKKES